jgi:hypothetical protein
MKRFLMACAACAAFVTAAPAQDMPTLSAFLGNCYRDANACRLKMKDYITASDTQHIICRPADMSVNDAASQTMHWLRADDTHDKSLNNAPFDDALFQATTTLWPCTPPPPPPAPPPEPAPQDQPAPATPQ